MGNNHQLVVAGRYEEIHHICHFMAHAARQVGLDESAIFHIELVCDEACTNIIEHAYSGEDKGIIQVSWQVVENHFVMTFHDQGQPFNPDQVPIPHPPPDATATQQEIFDNLQVGGLGIHFMRKLMDDVQFNFDEKGNTLVLIKQINAS